MKEISAETFKNFVTKNPEWASILTAPISIIGKVKLDNHPISKLSAHLHFQDEATFEGCPKLIEATGTFYRGVSFRYSNIQKIEKLNVKQSNTLGTAAIFENCKNLKVATGTYPGWVNFYGSGIEEIEDLKITQPNKDGDAASFCNCPNLKVFRGTYHGKVDLTCTPIRKGPKWLLNPNKANIDPQTQKRLSKTIQKEIDLPI